MEIKEKERLAALFGDFLEESLIQIFFGNPVDRERMLKARVRPFLSGGKLQFQLEEWVGKQVFHKNMDREGCIDCLPGFLEENFRQCEIQSEKSWAQVLVSRRGTVTIKRKKAAAVPGIGQDAAGSAGQGSAGKPARITSAGLQGGRSLSHNRKKAYVLEEGIPVPFLVDLGVMTKEGKVVHARYDKFRQINRFLEFIEDILPQLSRDRENTILDFGCGKSYLTFAMYYYLKVLKGYAVRIIGLDLKEEVIRHCNELAKKYGYETLAFFCGDIASYEGVSQVDMVVTLHACDTATDYALAKAVSWGAKVILSVPCCQHQWNSQTRNQLMKPILKYGLLKERMSALLTDGIRAELLEHAGYRTQILEFIDMEHTPKNLLIRAVKQGQPKDNEAEIRQILEFWQVEPELAKLLLPGRSSLDSGNGQ